MIDSLTSNYWYIIYMDSLGENLDDLMLLSTKNICDLLGISRSTFDRHYKYDKDLTGIKIGNSIKYPVKSLKDFLLKAGEIPSLSNFFNQSNKTRIESKSISEQIDTLKNSWRKTNETV